MTCFFCKGEMTAGTTTHVVNLGSSIIIVKNVPCELCVQCGEAFFNDAVAMKLEEIVGKVKDIVSEVAVLEYAKCA